MRTTFEYVRSAQRSCSGTRQPPNTLHGAQATGARSNPQLRNPRRQPLPQMLERAPHVCFDRLNTDAEQVGDLCVTKSAVATQLEHFATTCGQLLNCLFNSLREVPAFRIGVGARRLGRVERKHHSGTTMHCAVAKVIERSIANGLEQVALRRSIWIERITSTPQTEKYVLRQFFSECLFSHDALRRTHDKRVPAAEDGVKRIRVPRAQAPYQCGIIGIGRIGVGHRQGRWERTQCVRSMRILSYDEASRTTVARYRHLQPRDVGYFRPAVFLLS